MEDFDLNQLRYLEQEIERRNKNNSFYLKRYFVFSIIDLLNILNYIHNPNTLKQITLLISTLCVIICNADLIINYKKKNKLEDKYNELSIKQLTKKRN